MLSTLLFEEHLILEAKMTTYAGYQLPLMYSSVKNECLAVRSKAGIFDISHMGTIYIQASNMSSIHLLLNYLTCRTIPVVRGTVQYNALINEQGGIIDDITIYVLTETSFLVITNANNTHKVMQHLNHWNGRMDNLCHIYLSENRVLLAIQGPQAEEALNDLTSLKTIQIENLNYYKCTLYGANHENMISRTGYTGEDGFEIILTLEEAIQFWKNCIKANITPCGLAARDVLRMELFYPLYGNELSEDKTPVVSNLGWLVSHNKEFLGSQYIETQSQKKTIGFTLLDKAIPRSQFDIYHNERKVGYVTSGSFSFTWNQGFGIAYIESQLNHDLEVSIRNKKIPIQLHVVSPYKSHGSIKKRLS